MNKIEYYRFEIKPMSYLGFHGGEEKVLSMEVQVNGTKHRAEKVMPFQQRPWQTELDFYAELATRMLEGQLKKLDRYLDVDPYGDQ
jgi:hypothetical protein